MHIRELTLSILLTAVLTSCGGKKMNSSPLILPYGDDGLIVAALVDPAPVTEADQPYRPGDRLLQTNWGQGSPFNDALPLIDGERPVIGCVNTGMAQMLYYYRYPAKGQGVVAGKLLDQEAWADLNAPINWEHIPTDHRAIKEKFQREEVAQMMRNMAIVNKTNLGLSSQGGSGTVTDYMIKNLIKHYGFANSTVTMTSTVAQPNDAFFEAIIEEINNKRPVFLSLNGTLNHLVIADGYKIEDGEVLLHLNMGWQGLHDGFYSLKEPVQVIEEFTRDGSRWQRNLEGNSFTAYIGIKPCTQNQDCYVNLENSDKLEGNSIQGKLNHVGDEDLYGPFSPAYKVNIKLKDRTTAPFFITVLDEFKRPLAEDNRTVSIQPRAPYYIRVSTHSISTNRFYNNEASYRLSIKEERGAFETAPATTFKLVVSQTDALMRPDEKIIIRTSLVPYAPEDTFYRVINEEGSLVGEVTGNLIKLDAAVLNHEDLNRLTIQAKKSNEELISESKLNILIHPEPLSFGKNQELLGRFESSEQEISFKTVLEGECRISGDRGFSNQAFFLEVVGYERLDEAFQASFQPAVYELKASLKKGYRFYSYDSNKANFKISISCPSTERKLENLVELF